MPAPLPADPPTVQAHGLYEPCLAVHLDAPVVGTDLAAGGRSLVLVTGANQGGKSTFLRSVAVAQLMLPAGMFAPADSYSGSVHSAVFTISNGRRTRA
jgi:DNA mismatch repair ATPase MutS